MTNDSSDSERTDLQPIPKAQQDISLEEITDANYEVVDTTGAKSENKTGKKSTPVGRTQPPGRTRFDDSIEASSEDLGEDDNRDAYPLEYNSPAATRIGNDEEGDERVKRLRRLHDERHPAVGSFSSRDSEDHKERTVQAVSSSLPLTDREKELVFGVVKSLDFSRFGQQKSIPKVTLGVVAVVVDERHREIGDLEDTVARSNEFRETRESLGVSMSDLGTIKKRVRDALDEQKVNVGPTRPSRDPLLPGPTPMDKLPREYWDRFPEERWESIAKQWELQPPELKDAIPDDYQRLIHKLRDWKPWEMEQEESNQTASAGSVLPEKDREDISSKELEAELDALAEEVERELDSGDTNN